MAARRSAAWGLAGALTALAGTAAARCGGSCTACFACAVPGAGLVLAALWRRGRPAERAGESAREAAQRSA